MTYSQILKVVNDVKEEYPTFSRRDCFNYMFGYLNSGKSKATFVDVVNAVESVFTD